MIEKYLKNNDFIKTDDDGHFEWYEKKYKGLLITIRVEEYQYVKIYLSGKELLFKSEDYNCLDNINKLKRFLYFINSLTDEQLKIIGKENE